MILSLSPLWWQVAVFRSLEDHRLDKLVNMPSNEFWTFVNPAVTFLKGGELFRWDTNYIKFQDCRTFEMWIPLPSPVSFRPDLLRIKGLEQNYVSVR